MKVYDLIVIGGGAAGFSAIVKFREVAGPDKSIALISRGPLGGTCVNVGCVPSKYLIEVARYSKLAKLFNDRGVSVTVSFDFPKVMSSLRSFISSLRRGRYEALLDYYNVDFYPGIARFTSQDTVEVRGDSGVIELRGKAFIVATGSRPYVPPIDGLAEVGFETSDTIWGLDTLPDSMLVIGGGAVGVELAQAFSRLGSKVDIVEAMDRIVAFTEPQLSRALTSILEDEGVRVMVKSRVIEVRRVNGRIRARIVTHRGVLEEEYELILVATGRKPNTDNLGLENAGVEVDGRGYVRVSMDLRTSNPIVYAAGDVAGTPKPALLETLAAREGAVAAYNIAMGARETIDYEITPVVVFTDPELAMVGVTEEKLMEVKGACSCRIARFNTLPKSGIIGVKEGLAKIVVDPEDRVIRGFHILAPNASEYVAVASLMIKHRYKVEDIVNTILAFPTSSEILKVTAQTYLRNIERMPCCVE